MNEAGAAVRLRDVWFTYRPTGVRGRQPPPSLRGVNLDIRPGEVYGILGPNGAGKTTLLKVLTTLLLAERGEVEVLGHRLPGGEEAVRARMGVALGEHERTFHFRLTGRQNLRFFADFLGVPAARAKARIDVVLQEVGLGEAGDKPFLAYSTGMKHRLAVARALLHEPDLLVLDEPTAGLDAKTSAALGELVRRLAREEEATVVYTTHRLEEAGRLCDRIAILRAGRVVAVESPGSLRRLSGGTSVVALRLDRVDDALLADFKAQRGVRAAFQDGPQGARCHVDDVEATLASLLAAAEKHGRRVLGVRTEEPTIEDAFLALTREVEFTVVRP